MKGKALTHYHYSGAQLHCENVSIADLADRVKTPVYVYSRRTYRDNYHAIDQAFGRTPHRICYALKANSNPHLLRDYAQMGAGADVVSVGEMRLAMRAGISPSHIVFAGVGKRDDEIVAGIEAGIKAFHVESEAELRVIEQLAKNQKKRVAVALRINPNIDIHGHPYISTGRSADKFGIELNQVHRILSELRRMEYVRLAGLHIHVGSQITEVSPFDRVGEVLSKLAQEAQAVGHVLDYLDVGGGLGVTYEDAMQVRDGGRAATGFAVEPNGLAQGLLSKLSWFKGEILFEPGRALVASSGVLVTRVLFVKETGGKRFAVVDAGMSDLIRPSLYSAYHQIVPLHLKEGVALQEYDVVGPICESGDFLGRNRMLPPIQRGDLLAVMTAGAYGYTLSSNYNARPRPAEVIVDGGEFLVSREREAVDDIWE